MLLSIHGLPSTGKVRATVLSLLFVCQLADLLQGGSGKARGRGRSSKECYLNISNTLPVWQPVVITQGGLVVPQAPTNWSAAITLDDRAILACPGKRNKMSLSRGNEMNVTCRGGDQLEMDGKVYPARDLGCTKATQGKALDTEERCADHATILQLGFE
ncbi:unnamed protein product, partial [Timema podura]|nr:unnamed protein product [Timema podura]